MCALTNAASFYSYDSVLIIRKMRRAFRKYQYIELHLSIYKYIELILFIPLATCLFSNKYELLNCSWLFSLWGNTALGRSLWEDWGVEVLLYMSSVATQTNTYWKKTCSIHSKTEVQEEYIFILKNTFVIDAAQQRCNGFSSDLDAYPLIHCTGTKEVW